MDRHFAELVPASGCMQIPLPREPQAAFAASKTLVEKETSGPRVWAGPGTL